MRGAIVFAAIALYLTPELIFQKTAPVYDDRAVFVDNQHVRGGEYGAIWSSSYWAGVPALYQKENLQRPMFLTAAALLHDHFAWARSLSVLAHLGVACLAALFAAEALAGAFAFFVFLLHPAQVETTAQAIGLLEEAPTLLGLLAFWLAKRRPWLAVAIAALAPGWKEIGYVWLLGLAIVLGAGWGVPRRRAPAIASLAVLGGWLLHRYLAYGALFSSSVLPYSVVNPLVEMNGWDFFWSRLSLLGQELRLLVAPIGLTSDYGKGSLPLPGYPIQIWVIVALGFLGALWRFRKEIPPACWIAMATLLPTLHLTGPTGAIFGERYGYAFRWGLIVFAASALTVARQWSWPKPAKVILGSFAVLAAAGMIAQTVHRSSLWVSGEKLFSEDLERYPRNPKLHYNLALAEAQLGKWSEAEKELLLSVNLAPDFPDGHLKLAQLYRQIGKPEQAQVHLNVARELGAPEGKL